MPHILMVCTANICRSPVATAILREKLHKQEEGEWMVTSAGTWAQRKRGASRHSIQVAGERGLDITEHQAQMIDAAQLKEADLVLCMEAGHAEALRAEFPIYAQKIHLLSEMIGKKYNINDPYGGPVDEYEIMADELTGIIEAGFARIVALAKENASSD